MRCTFCATGKGGFARNLRVHEIVDQVLTVQEHFGTRVSNVGGHLQGFHYVTNQHPIALSCWASP